MIVNWSLNRLDPKLFMLLMITGVVVWNLWLHIMAHTLNILLENFLRLFGQFCGADNQNKTLCSHFLGHPVHVCTRLYDAGATGERDAVLSLADDVSTWQSGDKIVIASSDYDMNHAEVFTLVYCPSCTANQVKINGLYSFGQAY